jgi:hypothetical protein
MAPSLVVTLRDEQGRDAQRPRGTARESNARARNGPLIVIRMHGPSQGALSLETPPVRDLSERHRSHDRRGSTPAPSRRERNRRSRGYMLVPRREHDPGGDVDKAGRNERVFRGHRVRTRKGRSSLHPARQVASVVGQGIGVRPRARQWHRAIGPRQRQRHAERAATRPARRTSARKARTCRGPPTGVKTP